MNHFNIFLSVQHNSNGGNNNILVCCAAVDLLTHLLAAARREARRLGVVGLGADTDSLSDDDDAVMVVVATPQAIKQHQSKYSTTREQTIQRYTTTYCGIVFMVSRLV